MDQTSSFLIRLPAQVASIVSCCATCGCCDGCSRQSKCPHVALAVLYILAAIVAAAALAKFNSILESKSSTLVFLLAERYFIDFEYGSPDFKDAGGVGLGSIIVVLAIVGAILAFVALCSNTRQEPVVDIQMQMSVPGVTAGTKAADSSAILVDDACSSHLLVGMQRKLALLLTNRPVPVANPMCTCCSWHFV